MKYLSRLLHQFIKALGLKAEQRPPADAPLPEVSGTPGRPGE